MMDKDVRESSFLDGRLEKEMDRADRLKKELKAEHKRLTEEYQKAVEKQAEINDLRARLAEAEARVRDLEGDRMMCGACQREQRPTVWRCPCCNAMTTRSVDYMASGEGGKDER